MTLPHHGAGLWVHQGSLQNFNGFSVGGGGTAQFSTAPSGQDRSPAAYTLPILRLLLANLLTTGEKGQALLGILWVHEQCCLLIAPFFNTPPNIWDKKEPREFLSLLLLRFQRVVLYTVPEHFSCDREARFCTISLAGDRETSFYIIYFAGNRETGFYIIYLAGGARRPTSTSFTLQGAGRPASASSFWKCYMHHHSNLLFCKWDTYSPDNWFSFSRIICFLKQISIFHWVAQQLARALRGLRMLFRCQYTAHTLSKSVSYFCHSWYFCLAGLCHFCAVSVLYFDNKHMGVTQMWIDEKVKILCLTISPNHRSEFLWKVLF